MYDNITDILLDRAFEEYEKRIEAEVERDRLNKPQVPAGEYRVPENPFGDFIEEGKDLPFD